MRLLCCAYWILLTNICFANDVWISPTPSPAQNVRVSGDINKRIKLAVRYLDRATRRQLWSGFEKELTNDHSFGLWCADWPGRTLEQLTFICSRGLC